MARNKNVTVYPSSIPLDFNPEATSASVTSNSGDLNQNTENYNVFKGDYSYPTKKSRSGKVTVYVRK